MGSKKHRIDYPVLLYTLCQSTVLINLMCSYDSVNALRKSKNITRSLHCVIRQI